MVLWLFPSIFNLNIIPQLLMAKMCLSLPLPLSLTLYPHPSHPSISLCHVPLDSFLSSPLSRLLHVVFCIFLDKMWYGPYGGSGVGGGDNGTIWLPIF